MTYIDWKCESIDVTAFDSIDEIRIEANLTGYVRNYGAFQSRSLNEIRIEANLTGYVKNYGAFQSRSLNEIAHEIEADMNRDNRTCDHSDSDIDFAAIYRDACRASKETSSHWRTVMSHSICYEKKPQIINVKFNPPATIVFWSDKTKTVVKAQDDEPFDPEKGLAMAMVKKYLGNKGSYFNEISKWTEKYEEPICEYDIKLCTGSSPFADVAEALRKAFAKPSIGKHFKPQQFYIKDSSTLMDIVQKLNELIINRGYATLKDYYDLVEYNSTEECSKYGWTKDPTFQVRADMGMYYLELSEAKLLEGVD